MSFEDSITAWRSTRPGKDGQHANVDSAAGELSANALRVLEARYLQRDEHGNIVETPDELFQRVAKAVAQAEDSFDDDSTAAWEQQFYEVMARREFLPNSPTLMNADTAAGQLSSCFVVPVPDSTEGIFDAIKKMAIIQRQDGGTGFSFSRLRPKNDRVASIDGQAAGPVAFMKIFDCATEQIKQGGKRRGANMGVLRVDHPDILEFIQCKLDGVSLQNFNLSVAVHDGFMQALDQVGTYPLVHPRTGRVVGELKARKVFEALSHAAWRGGDPGLLFLDVINRRNSTPALGLIEATNPCGEVPLLPYESCNLGSINLAKMVQDENGTVSIDWDRLGETVQMAVRFLDDVIEVSHSPLPEIEWATKGNRKIGLGVMGFAEMLVLLGVSYNSDKAVDVALQVMRFINEEALAASHRLAECRGTFPNWPSSIYQRQNLELRNATRTAIAPTGTIGIIAGTSPGIEPFFALAYRRANVLEGQTLWEFNPLFLEYMDRYGLGPHKFISRVEEHGSLAAVSDAPPELKRLFVTALEIAPERHLQIQAAFQRHVDNSVSKTINLPVSATPRDVATIYKRAWQLGLKGITVFRYNSRARQVMQLGANEQSYHYEYRAKCDPHQCTI